MSNSISAALEDSMLSSELDDWRLDLIKYAVKYDVFRFGKFTLKSGRVSPYFFNIGNFCDGEALLRLASAYAREIHASGIEFDVLFGPAYKGISIVACTALVLAQKYNKNYPFIYDRKEVKSHGEGGVLVGAVDKLTEGMRVLILDDVITGGTAMRQAMTVIKNEGKCSVVGMVVCLDREEYFGGEDISSSTNESAADTEAGQREGEATEIKRESALRTFEKSGIKVRSLIKMSHIITFLKQLVDKGEDHYSSILGDMRKYREVYGVES